MNILSYVMAGFGVAYLVNSFVNSGILVHVYNLFSKKTLYTREDLRYELMTKVPHFVHELLHCELCMSLWVATLLSIWFTQVPLEIAGIAGLGYTILLIWKRLVKQEVDVEPAPEENKEKIIQALSQVTGIEKEDVVEAPKEVSVVKKTSKKGNKLKNLRLTYSKLGQHFYKDTGDTSWNFDYSDENRDVYLGWLENPESLCGPGMTECSVLYGEYQFELAKLHEKAANEGVECSKCEIGNIQNKYYNKVKKWHASLNQEVSGSGSQTKP